MPRNITSAGNKPAQKWLKDRKGLELSLRTSSLPEDDRGTTRDGWLIKEIERVGIVVEEIAAEQIASSLHEVKSQ